MEVIIPYLLDQGPLGLVTLALGWALMQERRRNDKLNDAFRDLVGQMFETIKKQGRRD